MAAAPNHRRIKQSNLIGGTRRQAAERFTRNVEQDRGAQRESRRRFVSQALQVRDTLPLNNEICAAIAQIQEHARELPPSLQLEEFPALKAAVFAGCQPPKPLLSSVEKPVSPSADSYRVSLERFLEQLLCVLPFESDAERVFDVVLHHSDFFKQIIGDITASHLEMLNSVSENIYFLLLCVMALLASQKQSEVIQLEFHSLIVHSLRPDRPISLRCVQVASWTLFALDRYHHAEAPSVMTIDNFQHITTNLISLTHFASTLLLSEMHLQHETTATEAGSKPAEPFSTDPFQTPLGDLGPVGGCIGFLRVAFQLLSSATKYPKICELLLSNEDFISTIMDLVNIVLQCGFNGPLASPLKFLPDSHLRLLLEDALCVLDDCLCALCDGIFQLSIPFPCSRLVELIWTLCFSVSNVEWDQKWLNQQISGHPSQPGVAHWMVDFRSFLLDGSGVGLDRLIDRPSDVMVPGIHLLGSLCFHHTHSEQHGRSDILHRFLELDGIIPPIPEPGHPPCQVSQSRLLIKALLSKHNGIKRSALHLIALLAVSGEPYCSIAVDFVPIVARILFEPEPFFVKRAALQVISSFHRGTTHLPKILEMDVPPLSAFNSLSLSIDQTEPEQGSSSCNICHRSSVVDSILAQLSSSQFDVPLVNMCLDYLEELLGHSPDEMRVLLFRHGVIEKVESVQSINNDDLFHRTIKFVERHYDDFEEALA